MKRGRGDVGVRMMHEGGDSDYTGGSICLTDTLPGGKQKTIKLFFNRESCCKGIKMRVILHVVIFSPEIISPLLSLKSVQAYEMQLTYLKPKMLSMISHDWG